MKTKFGSLSACMALISLLLIGSCSKDKKNYQIDEEEQDGYMVLKQKALEDQSVFYQDFDKSETLTQITSDQWKIGTNIWWVPQWNATTVPVIKDSSLVLTSTKSPQSASTKNEVQTISDFPISRDGEFIAGYRSSRWKYGYSSDANWVDSSIGLEFFYNPPHQAIVFTYGSMGVFSDPTGYCPDNTCMYSKSTGWPEVSTGNNFLGIRITWKTEADNTRTFRLYINNDEQPRAELKNVTYPLQNLRVRLNANVTDADKLPVADSDTLYVDYVSIKDHIMSLK